jgi:hypothetical protein
MRRARKGRTCLYWTLDKRLLNSGAVITEIAIRLPHVEQLKLEF